MITVNLKLEKSDKLAKRILAIRELQQDNTILLCTDSAEVFTIVLNGNAVIEQRRTKVFSQYKHSTFIDLENNLIQGIRKLKLRNKC